MVFVEFRRSLVIVYMRFNSSPLFAVSSCVIMLCHVAEADDVRDIVVQRCGEASGHLLCQGRLLVLRRSRCWKTVLHVACLAGFCGN